MQMSRIVAALVDLGYPKSYQAHLQQQVSHLSYLAVAAAGPVSWLDEVKEGFGMRYGAAFASEGFEDAEDLQFSCPTQQHLESILEKAGAAKPQVERITAALVKLTGAPLQQEEPQKDAGRSTPPSSYFGAKERPPSPAATPTANTWSSESFTNTPAQVAQATPSTRARSLTEEDDKLEILRQRSAALTVDVVPEEGRGGENPERARRGSQLNYGGTLNAAATSLWTGPPSAGTRPTRAISKRASGTFGSGAARWSSTSSMEGTKSKKGSSSKIHAVVSPKGKARQDKHAMLSYQWDHQTEVTAIRKMLEARGIGCWMDVDQMQSDIYDSMAEGVQGARVIVCFMSQPYQDSANCKLELKFAQQSGKPIVPVKLVPEFEATGWLGIITAGSLWTSVDLDNLEDGAEKIVKQIDRTMEVYSKRPGSVFSDTDGDTDQSSTEDDEEEGFSVEDMRGELERLMSDLRVAKYSKGSINPDDAASVKTATELCKLPAVVPNNPAGLRVTDEMKELLAALLVTPTVGHQVGFCGMGGLGKTVVSTWLVRQDEVRKMFEKIVWITLGQTPNMEKCQQMLFMQLMGFEMNRDMSDDEVKQSLMHALQGKNVLMVLDDAWEVAHCEQLAFIDDATQSKLLVSSRVKGVLEGGSIVDLNLPSDYDAQKMLLNEAGLDADPSDAPPEAAEVTKFCNNLPLAVGMAGRLLKTMSLSIDDDWSGVVAVLKSEFGEGGQARSMENSIIRTSLKSVRGSQHDEVVQLFHAFALVPEDTVCASFCFPYFFWAVGFLSLCAYCILHPLYVLFIPLPLPSCFYTAC